MKISIKIISFTLLIAFFGLLTIGIIADQSLSSNQHSGSVNCFGVGCGPIEHVVVHDYFVAEVLDEVVFLSLRYQDTTYQFIIFQTPDIIPDFPPPKFSLS